MSVKRIIRALQRHKRFIISAHVDLEGDALGSEIALAYLLKSLGKTVSIMNNDLTPKAYNFLPGKHMIRSKRGAPAFDAAIVIDCSDIRRIGRIQKFISDTTPLINIDHHISNEKFGDTNWIDTKASSASEMVYWLYKALRKPIKKEAAIALYTGIATDTGFFRYSNTSSKTHAIASELLKHKINVYDIYRHLYQHFSLKETQLLASILASIKVDSSKKIAWVELSRNTGYHDIKKEFSDIIFGFLRSIEGVEVAIIFRERGKKATKINLRSQSRVNVGAFAVRFGGGGHARASGCFLEKDLASTRKQVVSELQQLVREK
ncbi:bifunctional oligoribonuclease/PAP phosphatase NrnA [Candidatus Omnitrophota bacterium]